MHPEHKQEIKEIYDLYNEELQEKHVGQHGRILELKHVLKEENEELKGQKATDGDGEPCGGIR